VLFKHVSKKQPFFPGISCIEPPIPPNETHLIRHYLGGETTQFGQFVNYTCEPGYFFGDDYDQGRASLDLKCQS
jgi:hypothetical protein